MIALRVFSKQSNKFVYGGLQYQFGSIKTFILPDLGEKIKEATIKEWHVKVGDVVEEFQTIADVSTDKLFTQIPSSYNGTIKKLYYDVEDLALIGEAFIDIEVEEDGAVVEQKQEESQDNQQQQQNIEGKVQASPATRGLAKQLNVDINLLIGQGSGKDGRITDADVRQFASNPNAQQLTPATRALAQQHNIDIALIRGTGKGGRVSKGDILSYIEKNPQSKQQQSQQQQSNQQQQESSSQQKPVASTGAASFSGKVIKMTNFAQGMQKSMTVSNTIPHLYVKEEIDMNKCVEFREQLKQQGHKITFMTIFVKAFSLALKEYPIINSVYENVESNPFQYKIIDNHNITIAINSPHGLVVPNLKNVQDLNLLEVQAGINELRQKADKGQLGPKELFEGSVSISNVGTVGGTYAAPLIFAPQTSIVAIGRMQNVPRFDDKMNVVPTRIVNVSLGCDHRVIDGASAAGFIMHWKTLLENPSSMLLRMR